MVSVNDPRNYEGKLKQAFSRLEAADIDDKDKAAINAWMERRQASGKDYSASNEGTNLTIAINAARYAPKPLHEFEQDELSSDFDSFINGLESGDIGDKKEYSPSYVRKFRQVLRLYFKHLGKEWAEDIHVGQPEVGDITEEDCFTSDECARLFAEADVRDSAILALQLATGQRVTAMASLRVTDVKIEGSTGGFHLNPKAVGLKGAEGYRPLIWATPYIKRWLDQNPWYDNPEEYPDEKEGEAPLFCTERGGRHYDKGDPLGYNGFLKVLRRLCEAAGIDPEKAKTHRVRHTAIRRMIRDGLSEQRIKYMVGWHSDSTHLERYGSLKDESHAADVRGHYGIDDPTETDSDEITQAFEDCPGCGRTLSELTGSSFCPDCGTPLEHSAENIERMADKSLWDSKGEAETQEESDGVDAAKKALNDPEAKAAVMDELKDEILAELKDEI